MIYHGWVITGLTASEQAEVVSDLAARLCEHFNLCASVGCACVTGKGKQVCYELSGGDRYLHHYSEGPTWSASITALQQSVRVDLHLDGPIIGTEFSAFYQEILKLNHPIFILQGSGSNKF